MKIDDGLCGRIYASVLFGRWQHPAMSSYFMQLVIQFGHEFNATIPVPLPDHTKTFITLAITVISYY